MHFVVFVAVKISCFDTSAFLCVCLFECICFRFCVCARAPIYVCLSTCMSFVCSNLFVYTFPLLSCAFL